MNKTVNINIGGLFFHIDDNAYSKLNTYLEAIKHSLAEDSKDEVMNDVEGRIAEILSDRILPDKQVVNILDIEYIISIMGQPEDYVIEDESYKQTTQSNYNNTTTNFTKKLYRDEDEGKIGGVCAGLSHYFGIDSIWIRIIFLILFFSTAGTSMLLYLILWIVIPKAVTTSEKLQMKGEPINIANIEKKIKENFNSEEFNKKTNNAVSAIEKFLKQLFTIFSKIFGVLLAFVSILSLGSILIFGGMLMLNFASVIENMGNMDLPFESISLFWFAVLIILSAGIPLLFLFLLSLKILNSNFKVFGKYTTITLLILWIISLFGWTIFGLSHGLKEQYTGKSIEKIELNLTPTDTLIVTGQNNTFFTANENPSYTGKIMINEIGNKVLYSNRVELIFNETDEQPYVLVEKTANSNNIDEATKIAKQINYNSLTANNQIKLDNYYTSNNKNKKNRKAVKVYAFIPKNTVVKLNNEAKYLANIYTNENSKNQVFKLDDYNELKCINCETTNKKIKLEIEIDSILNSN